MIKQAIEERTVTKLGISIGTGLALETLFDVEVFDTKRDIPKRVEPTTYPTHVYNIYTLFRNVLSSIKYKDKEQLVTDKLVKDQLLNDMYLLIELYTGTNVDLIFYLPDYTLVQKRYNKHKDPKPYTPAVTHSFITASIKDLAYPGTVLKGNSDSVLPSSVKATLILTHFTMDLLSIKNIPKLALLESHTGRIKSKIEWGKKYHPIGKRDLSVLPIHKRILYILGDKTLVKPLVISDRTAFYELVMTNSWTPLTSPITIDKLTKKFKNNIPV